MDGLIAKPDLVQLFADVSAISSNTLALATRVAANTETVNGDGAFRVGLTSSNQAPLAVAVVNEPSVQVTQLPHVTVDGVVTVKQQQNAVWGVANIVPYASQVFTYPNLALEGGYNFTGAYGTVPYPMVRFIEGAGDGASVQPNGVPTEGKWDGYKPTTYVVGHENVSLRVDGAYIISAGTNGDNNSLAISVMD